MHATYLARLILIKFISRYYLKRSRNYEKLYTTYNTFSNLITKFLLETFIIWSMKASEIYYYYYYYHYGSTALYCRSQ
jgi:hypothetical protein